MDGAMSTVFGILFDTSNTHGQASGMKERLRRPGNVPKGSDVGDTTRVELCSRGPGLTSKAATRT